MSRLRLYLVKSEAGIRHWHAEDAEHAREQHRDAFPDEKIERVERAKAGYFDAGKES